MQEVVEDKERLRCSGLDGYGMGRMKMDLVNVPPVFAFIVEAFVKDFEDAGEVFTAPR